MSMYSDRRKPVQKTACYTVGDMKNEEQKEPRRALVGAIQKFSTEMVRESGLPYF